VHNDPASRFDESLWVVNIPVSALSAADAVGPARTARPGRAVKPPRLHLADESVARCRRFVSEMPFRSSSRREQGPSEGARPRRDPGRRVRGVQTTRARRRQFAATTVRMPSPYASRFLAPMPVIPSRSPTELGRAAAIARRVASPNTMYAGTPCSRAFSPRAQRLEQVAVTGGHVVGAAFACATRATAAARATEGIATKRHRGLTAQDTGGRLAEGKGAVVALCRDDPSSQELTDDAAPVLVRQVGPEPVGAEPIVSLLGDALGLRTAEDVDQMARAEGLTTLALEAHDRRQQLLRRDETVPRVGRGETGVAVAARLGSLPEVVEEVLPSASDRLAQGQHRVEVLPEPHLVRTVAGRLIDHAALLHDVAEPIGHPHGRRVAVAAGATGLLVVALDGLGQIDVSDEAHVGLVDAHAEGDRGDHDDAVVAEEP